MKNLFLILMLGLISVFAYVGCELYTGTSLSAQIEDLLDAGSSEPTDPTGPTEPAEPPAEFSCSAGADFSASALGKTVSLSGSVSNPAGAGVTYSWSASAANPSTITLSNSNTNSPSFDIDLTTKEGEYTFTLTANDGSTEVSDDVIVTVDYMTKLTIDNVSAGTGYGYTVAISSDGSTALVGAYNEAAAYLYTSSGTSWSLQKTLTPSAGGGNFGYSLALSSDGTTAVIGAYGDSTKAGGAGAVFVYSGTAWGTENILYAQDAAASDSFGRSVSITPDGTTALIGSHLDSREDSEGVIVDYAGSAYIFSNAGGSWLQTGKLTNPDGNGQDFFGHSVSLSSDGRTALIGAYSDDVSTGSGQAFIYTYSDAGATWTQTNLLASDMTSDAWMQEYFGYSVSLSADGMTALIGAYRNDDVNDISTDEMGAAYIYTCSEADGSWSRSGTLKASDRAAKGQFGYSVSLSADGSVALVGALNLADDGMMNFTSAPEVYIYSGPGYGTETIITSSDSGWSQIYDIGRSVSMSADGTTFIVGSYKSAMLTGGAAYCFNIEY